MILQGACTLQPTIVPIPPYCLPQSPVLICFPTWPCWALPRPWWLGRCPRPAGLTGQWESQCSLLFLNQDLKNPASPPGGKCPHSSCGQVQEVVPVWTELRKQATWFPGITWLCNPEHIPSLSEHQFSHLNNRELDRGPSNSSNRWLKSRGSCPVVCHPDLCWCGLRACEGF